jgi:ribosomal protein L11 methyltransferase
MRGTLDDRRPGPGYPPVGPPYRNINTMKNATWCLKFSIARDQYDTVLTIIGRPGFLGCEEHSDALGTALAAHYKTESHAQKAAQEVTTAIPDIIPAITRIEPQDWNAQWRKSMKPARIARGYYVSPLWLPPPRSCRHWIKIEPKMAFGTGHHETTRLAAQAIISLRPRVRGKRMIDIGTGSGVLCFVADRCGASFTLGIEIDPDCRENIAENLANNRPLGRIAFHIGSTNALRTTAQFDLVAMNMLLAESAPLLPQVSCLLKPNGRLIWSGILADEHREAIDLAKPRGLRCIAKKEENEWWCGTFKNC